MADRDNKRPNIILSPREEGCFWRSHGVQVNGEGFCQSRTDYREVP